MEMLIARGACIYYVPGTDVTTVIVCVSVIIVNPQNSVSE